MSSKSTLVSAWSFGDVGQVVEDDQIQLVELCDGGFELQLTPRDLELLHEIGGSGEQYAPAILDQGEADRGRKMRLSAAGTLNMEKTHVTHVNDGFSA